MGQSSSTPRNPPSKEREIVENRHQPQQHMMLNDSPNNFRRRVENGQQMESIYQPSSRPAAVNTKHRSESEDLYTPIKGRPIRLNSTPEKRSKSFSAGSRQRSMSDRDMVSNRPVRLSIPDVGNIVLSKSGKVRSLRRTSPGVNGKTFPAIHTIDFSQPTK